MNSSVEIFNLLISKLDIPKRWKLRLARHFWREEYFNDLSIIILLLKIVLTVTKHETQT